jgi:hypothetical protein
VCPTFKQLWDGCGFLIMATRLDITLSSKLLPVAENIKHEIVATSLTKNTDLSMLKTSNKLLFAEDNLANTLCGLNKCA